MRGASNASVCVRHRAVENYLSTYQQAVTDNWNICLSTYQYIKKVGETDSELR